MIIVVIFITASIGDKTVLKHNLNNFHILKKKKKKICGGKEKK